MKTTDLYHIKEASPEDASLFSDIAWQSKKYWGYPFEWMELWKKELTVSPDMIRKSHSYKALLDGRTVGYAIITDNGNMYEVDHCFVLPQFIGKGCGCTLLEFILSQPIYFNTKFQLIADPNAVGFYEMFGFKTIGQIESQPRGRTLPLMQLVIDH